MRATEEMSLRASVRVAESPTRSLSWTDSPWTRTLAALLISAFAGFALTLSTAPTGWWPVAFLSVTLGLATLTNRSVPQALIIGTAFGAAFLFPHLVWVGRFFGPLPWIALASLESLLFGIGAIAIALAYRWTRCYEPHGALQRVGVPMLVGGLWATREWIMGSWPYSGFPWMRLGITQVGGPLTDVASWVGISGLSFLIAAFCASVLQWLRRRNVRLVSSIIPVAVLGAALAGTPQFPTAPAGSLRVGWVQGNGPAGYFDPGAPGDVFAAQVAATQPLLGEDLDLLAWPEGGVDSDPLNDVRTADALDSLVSTARAPLLMNAATAREGGVFNTSMLWTGSADLPQLHDKANPVPFGEYIPDRWFYQLIAPDLVGLIQREYSAGENAPAVSLRGVTVGLAICFDVLYDTVIWDGVRNDAQLFVLQSNNADFRGTDENLQQLAFAQMRAIETGRSVVNVSTVGTSQVIGPDGTILDTLPVDEAAATITEVPLRTGLTPASILGPVLAGLLPVTATAGLLVLGWFARQASRRGLVITPEVSAIYLPDQATQPTRETES